MTDTSTPRFALPGKWGRISLASEVETSRSIRKVLDEATNRRDDLASTRAELRTRFQTAADSAREGGATDFYVAFKLTAAIPLPAWAAVFTPRIESTDFHALGLGDLNKFLEAGTRKWGPEGSGVVASDSGVDGAVHAVRHSWRRVHDVTEGQVERTFEFVEADYWLAAQNPNRIALLTFSTALADYES